MNAQEYGTRAELAAAIHENVPHLRPSLLDRRMATSYFDAMFASLQGLDDYDQFLRRARLEKSRRTKASNSYDGLVLKRAVRAEQELDNLLEKLTEVTQYSTLAGHYHDSLDAFRTLLMKTGPLQASKLAEHALELESVRKILEQVPLEKRTLQRITKELTKVSALVSAASEGVEVTPESGDRRIIYTGSVPSEEAGELDVLRVNRYAIAAVAIGDAGSGAPVNSMHNLEGEDPQIFCVDELFAAVSTLAREEMRGHINGLKQVGVPVYQGREGFVGLLIGVIALWLLYEFIKWICSYFDDPKECEDGAWIFVFISLVLGSGKNPTPGSQSPTLTTYSNPSP